MNKKVKIHLISLGCAKNLVNSQQMLHLLKQAGYTIVDSAENAQVVVVNTCGFIESAKSEAIDTILQVAQLKARGLKALIVAGCLTERYREDVLHELPEVDVVCGTGSYTDIVAAVECGLQGNRQGFFATYEEADLEGERTIAPGTLSAYLKISEGCDNRCNYCVIPSLRGHYRSRPMERLIEEARYLAGQGIKELMIIAQDITRYGTDLYGKRCLHQLVDELCKIEEFKWIRLHYLYPDEIDDILLETIKNQPKVLKYFDIPIQHINNRVLKDMNRRGSGQLIRERFLKIRGMMPDAVFRTSLIVGFPGETDEEYQELYDFLVEFRLERAGVFTFSKEEGSVAYDMPDQVDEGIKKQRYMELFKLQTDIMDTVAQGFVGKSFTVLCEGYDPDEEKYYGRTYMDAPDIDGVVYIENGSADLVNKFINVKITDAVGCVLYGATAEEVI